MPSYTQDRTWQDRYTSQVLVILKALLPYCVELSIAPAEEDNKRATDYLVTMSRGSIAVRLRRAKYDQRDLTIRSRRDNGSKTERAKIVEGHAYRYFYGWTDSEHRIVEWILVDLDKVRQTRLLERNWYEYPNKDEHGEPDGTWFIAIPAFTLDKMGCLLQRDLKFVPMPPRQVNHDASLAEGVKSVPKCYSPRVEMNQQALWEMTL